MIWKVKKSNFIIYLVSIFIGTILIIVSILLNWLECPELINNIFLSVGCSTIPTVIVAYLIDMANETREKEKKKELRDSFLWGMPNGLLWISRVIIEEYYPFEDSKDMSFICCFRESILNMTTIKLNDDNFVEYSNKRDNLMKRLDYGISLCLQNCKPILEHEYELQINSIFSKEELLHIRYLFEECERIKNSYIIAETAEYIKLFVEEIYKSIEEVKMQLDRKIIVENRYVRNWVDISK